MIRPLGAWLLWTGLLSPALLAQLYTVQALIGNGLPIQGPARSMDLGIVGGVAVDKSGNVYASISAGQTSPPLTSLVVKIDPAGRLSRVAGNGTVGFGGDGGPATWAQVEGDLTGTPIAVDIAGNLFIVALDDEHMRHSIRRVDASTGVITTMDGTDGVQLIAVDATGNLYFAADGIYKSAAATGTVTCIATCPGLVSLWDDGGPATATYLNNLRQLAADSAGNVYLADSTLGGAPIIRRIDAATGIINTVAGPGVPGVPGDGLTATQANFGNINDIGFDSAGNLFIAEQGRIRKVDAVTGIITTVAGNGSTSADSDDGAVVTAAPIGESLHIAVDAVGNVYYSDGYVVDINLAGHQRIRKVDAAGVLSTVAGSGQMDFSGDGGPVAGARISGPRGIATDSRGNVYVADTLNNRVRKVDIATGTITTVAGNGTAGFGGDGGPGPAAQLYAPTGLAVDSAANVYIADIGNHRVRRLDGATGIITTTAGGGGYGWGGDGGPAASAQLAQPGQVALDARGNLYVSDGVIRKISGGRISTINLPLIDPYECSGPSPWGLSFDSGGNLFVADTCQYVIWQIPANGTTATLFAGTGRSNAEGGTFRQPIGLAVDSSGNVLFSSTPSDGVKKVDRGSKAVTQVVNPVVEAAALAFGPSGTLYVPDISSNQVLAATPPGLCSVALDPTSLTPSPVGSSVPVSVQSSAPSCFWSVTQQPGWLTPFPSSGFGSGTVMLAAAPNTDVARSASLAIGGVPVQVSQDVGCRWSASRTTFSFPAEGGAATPNVTGCPISTPLTASGMPGWVYADKTQIFVYPNWDAARSATFTIAGVPFTIEQSGVGTTAPGLRFLPVTPCRVVDTRDPDGELGGPAMIAGSTRSFPLPHSACSIPATAGAYALNVTVVPAGTLPYLTLWPTGQSKPLVSTLNSWEGDVVANAALVPAGADGSIDVYAAGTTNVIIDVNGYFDSSDGNVYATNASGWALSDWFFALAPCRLADTRVPRGDGFGTPTLAAGESRSYYLSARCGMPTTGDASPALNVTAVPSPTVGYLGYLTIWPALDDRPNISTLNSWTGKVVANMAVVPAQHVSVFATDPTDLIMDVSGYLAPAVPGTPGAMSFYPVAPCRVADTRNPAGPFGGPIMEGGETRSFQVPASGCGVPATAGAYALNITVVPDEPLGYLTTWPTGSAQPFVSTLNSGDGSVVANAAIVSAGAGGAISVFVTDRTHVIVDINGYFAPYAMP